MANQTTTYVRQVATFLTTVATLNQTLMEAFNRLVNAFNQQDWPTVESMLDDNVTLTTLNPPQIFQPKAPVVIYLEDKIGSDNPVFTPLRPISVDSTTGQVSGVAMWEDHDNGVTTISKISYWFTFVLHPNNQWYVLYLAGTPD